MGDIVITARYGGPPTDFEFPSGMFSAFYVTSVFPSTSLLGLAGERRDLTLPAKPAEDKPKVVTQGVTVVELAQIAGAVAASKNDPELDSSLKEMAANNVTLRITVVQDAPAGFVADEQARTTITATGASATGPDHFAPNSTVDIVIVASRVDASGINDFAHVIAHEFTHLIRDAAGEFLSDSGSGMTTYSREGQTFQNLFGAFIATNYIDSLDIVTQSTGYNTDVTYGTSGNNLLDLGDADNTVYTYGGNDIVITGPGNDVIYVNGSGLKLVSDVGAGYDCIILSNIPTPSDLRLTVIGYDLYLTNRWSGVAPLDDPNAIILLDWKYYNGMDNVEFAKTADGQTIGLWGDNAGNPGGGGYGAAPTGDLTMASALSFEHEIVPLTPTSIWDIMESQFFQTSGSVPGRYAGLTGYTSYTIDTANPVFAQLEASAMAMSSAIFDHTVDSMPRLLELDPQPVYHTLIHPDLVVFA